MQESGAYLNDLNLCCAPEPDVEMRQGYGIHHRGKPAKNKPGDSSRKNVSPCRPTEGIPWIACRGRAIQECIGLLVNLMELLMGRHSECRKLRLARAAALKLMAITGF